MKKAYFAGGCFWCITPIFREMDGVLSVTSGYSGGDEVDPTYEQVKKQQTHHRETIEIVYDENKCSYKNLISTYLSEVDPFDEGGQFIDRGFSYTLAIFCTDDETMTITKAEIEKLEAESGKKAYILVERFKNFYQAEEYHQDYDLKNPEAFEQELIESGRKFRKI